jgi:hypothetical protein
VEGGWAGSSLGGGSSLAERSVSGAESNLRRVFGWAGLFFWAGPGPVACSIRLGMRPGGGPGRCPPLVDISLAYVKAQPGGGGGAPGRGRVNAALPDPALRWAGGADPAGARGGQLPGRRAGEGSGMPRHGAGPEGGGNGRGRADGRLGGRDGGTEDARDRSLRRVPPGLVD